MTISSETRKAGPFIGAGTLATYPFTFKVFSAADLVLTVLDTSTTVETTLVINSDYTVSLNVDQNASPGGTITLTAGNLATGKNLVITSDVAYLQPTDLTNQGGFFPQVITTALDRQTVLVQQVKGIVSRGIRQPLTDTAAMSDLPSAAERANKVLTFDAYGNPIAIVPSSGSIAEFAVEIANGTDPAKGARLVGDRGMTVADELKSLATFPESYESLVVAEDWTSAIQSAIDACFALGGGEVRLGPKPYDVSGTTGSILVAKSNVHIIGVPGKTKLNVTATTGGFHLIGAAGLVSNFSIHGVEFDGNGVQSANDTLALRIAELSDLEIRKCVFGGFSKDTMLLGETLADDVKITYSTFNADGCNGNGVRIYNNRRVIIGRNKFFGYKYSPIDTNPLTVANVQTFTVINSNQIVNDQVNWVPSNSTISLMGDRCICTKNSITYGGPIVVHEGSGFPRSDISSYVVANNIITDSNTKGIEVNQDVNSNIAVVSNTLQGCGSSSIAVINGTEPPVTLVHPTVVSGNVIHDTSTNYTYTNSNQPCGILALNASNLLVASNTIISPRFAGVGVLGGCDGVSVKSNLVRKHAGYAPSDLPTNYGGGIYAATGSGAYPNDLFGLVISNNDVDGVCLARAQPVELSDVRVGGICVVNDAGKVANVSILVNTVKNAKCVGIRTYDLTDSDIDGNSFRNVIKDIYQDANPVAVNVTYGELLATPTFGNHRRGSFHFYAEPSAGSFAGVVCVDGGSFVTHTAKTGSIVSGSYDLTVNDSTGFEAGQYIEIVGISGSRVILSITGNVLQLTVAANATVSGAAVTNHSPTFKTFGAISA